MAKLGPGQKKRVPLHKDYAKGLKSLGKTAVKASPPGMLFTAVKSIAKTLAKKKKKPEAKTGPIKKSKNSKFLEKRDKRRKLPKKRPGAAPKKKR